MPTNNFNSLNLIKLVACIMVIIVHVSAINISNISSPLWDVSNLLNSLSRICVPLFFMVSGALLIRNDISLGIFIKKRYSRIFPPL
ncbi:TPA: acyltransferase family protein, partial [Escherichia coli]|nr:acyltransferase family protein [Escherichia coli]